MTEKCNEQYSDYSKYMFTCRREAYHKGQHQSFGENYYVGRPELKAHCTWSKSGAMTRSVKEIPWNSCLECDILIEKEDDEYCLGCETWVKYMKNFDINYKNDIIVEGNLYRIGPVGGFGGRQFNIEFYDETRKPLTTNRLWDCGDVPSHFWDRIPDNADFVEDPNKKILAELIEESEFTK